MNGYGRPNGPVCIPRLQEALELASKAVLRRLAIEYLRQHDVSDALEFASNRLPEYLKKVEEIMQTSSELDRIRGPAFYGYEVEGIAPSDAFTTDYAEQTLRRVKPLVKLCIEFATQDRD